MRHRGSWAVWAAAMLCLVGAGAACASPQLLFVDDTAPPGGDGSSWASAHTDLQDALDAAQAMTGEVEIRIAAGVYRPDRGTGDRTMSFVVRGGVALVGGFPDGGGELGERDPGAHVTALCGDLFDNDDPEDPVTWSDNARHVVRSAFAGPEAAGTVGSLAGVTIRRGMADDRGGGVLWDAWQTGLSIAGCVVEENRAFGSGGGVFVGEFVPVLVSETVVRRNLAIGSGGGFEARQGGDFIDCEFIENSAGTRGGAIHGIATLRGGVFERNDADEGGAVAGWALAVGAQFTANTARLGGAVHTIPNSGLSVIEEAMFRDNVAAADGGAVYGLRVSLERSVFTGNRAGRDGGAVFVDEAIDRAWSCAFIGNRAGAVGGAMRIGWSTQSEGVLFSTFVGNAAHRAGGVNFDAADLNVPPTGLILWGNTDVVHGAGTVEAQTGGGFVSASIVQGGAGNEGAEPNFVDPLGADGVAWTGDEDLRLTPGSPAIDLAWLGDNLGPQFAVGAGFRRSRDLAGRVRFIDGDSDGVRRGDAGAYEAQDGEGAGVTAGREQSPSAATAPIALVVDGDRWRIGATEAVDDRVWVGRVDMMDRPTLATFVRAGDEWRREWFREIQPPRLAEGQSILGLDALYGRDDVVLIWQIDVPGFSVWHFAIEAYTLEGGAIVGPTTIDVDGGARATPFFDAARWGDALAVSAGLGPRILRRLGGVWTLEWSEESAYPGGGVLPAIGLGEDLCAFVDASDPNEPRVRVFERAAGGWMNAGSIDLSDWLAFLWPDIARVAVLGRGDAIAVGPWFGSPGGTARVWTREGEAWSGPQELPPVIPTGPFDESTRTLAATRDAFVVWVGNVRFDGHRGGMIAFYDRDEAGGWRVGSYLHEIETVMGFLHRIEATATGVLVAAADRNVGAHVFPTPRLESGPPCPADLTLDGAVDGADLGLLLGAWGSAGGAPDLNGDGAVDGADLGLLIEAWGVCG